MGTYTKTVAQFVATVLGYLGAALAGGVTPDEWVNVAILAVGAAAVFAAPNVPGAPVVKFVLSLLTAGLVVLQSVIEAGVTTGEWYQIAAAVAGALAVYGLANKGGTGVTQ